MLSTDKILIIVFRGSVVAEVLDPQSTREWAEGFCSGFSWGIEGLHQHRHAYIWPDDDDLMHQDLKPSAESAVTDYLRRAIP